MERRLAANLENWNERVGVHTTSKFYDVERWLREQPGPRAAEIDLLGDLNGKSLVHLQCHFGMDTLQWARAGVVVTGLDFSPAAVRAAEELAHRAGLADRATFVCSNVYDALEALDHQRYDVVYVSLGSLCWLPDVTAWGRIVARLLAPGGRVYIHDVHPFAATFDDDGEHLHSSYFEEQDRPTIYDDGFTYTDGAPLGATTTYEWNHSLAEIIAALLDHHLILDCFIEHDWTVFAQFPWLVQLTPNRWTVPEERPRIPLAFTIVAHAPAP